MINADDSIAPLYQKVKDHILKQIERGDLVPKSRVPSENELVAALKVSPERTETDGHERTETDGY